MAGTLKYLRSEDYNRVLHTLANKFAGEHQDTINIARKTLVDVSAVTFEPRADHTWDSILSIADEQDKILLLLDNAIEAVDGSLELEALKEELKTQIEALKHSLNYITVQPVAAQPAQEGLPEVLMIYSDDDEAECNELKKQFKVLEYTGLAVLRDFRNITGNDKPVQEEQLLGRACVVLFILSPGFFAGDHISYIRQRAGTGKIMIPVLLKPCLWERVKMIAGLLPIPRDGKFLNTYPNKEAGYAEVAQDVWLVLEQHKNTC